MVGKETIPITLGKRASRILLAALLVLALGLTIAALLERAFVPAGWTTFLLTLHTVFYLWLFRIRSLTSGIVFSAVVDGFLPLLALGVLLTL